MKNKILLVLAISVVGYFLITLVSTNDTNKASISAQSQTVVPNLTVQQNDSLVDSLQRELHERSVVGYGGMITDPEAVDLITKIKNQTNAITPDWGYRLGENYLYIKEKNAYLINTEMNKTDRENINKNGGEYCDSMTIYKLNPMRLNIPVAEGINDSHIKKLKGLIYTKKEIEDLNKATHTSINQYINYIKYCIKSQRILDFKAYTSADVYTSMAQKTFDQDKENWIEVETVLRDALYTFYHGDTIAPCDFAPDFGVNYFVGNQTYTVLLCLNCNIVAYYRIKDHQGKQPNELKIHYKYFPPELKLQMAQLVSTAFPQDTTIQSFLQKTEAESKDIEVLCIPIFTKNGNQEQIVFDGKVINHSPYPILGNLYNIRVLVNDSIGSSNMGNGLTPIGGYFIAPNDTLHTTLYSLNIKNNKVVENGYFFTNIAIGKTEITAYTIYKGRRSKRCKINLATKSVTEIN